MWERQGDCSPPNFLAVSDTLPKQQKYILNGKKQLLEWLSKALGVEAFFKNDTSYFF